MADKMMSETEGMNLYKDIVKDSPSAIYICDKNTYDLFYINNAAKAIVGKEGQDLTGVKCYQALMHRDKPCTFCRMQNMTKDSFNVRTFISPLTKRIFIMKGKLINWKGKTAHIEYITDDTERSNAHRELQKKFIEQECVSACNAYLSGGKDLNGSIQNVLREIGNFYNADRCVLMEYSKRDDRVRRLNRWTKSRLTPEYNEADGFLLSKYNALTMAMKEKNYETIQDVENVKSVDYKLYCLLKRVEIENVRSMCFDLDINHIAYLGVFNSDMTDPDSPLLNNVAFFIKHAMNRHYTEREFEETLTLAAEQSGLVVWRYDIDSKKICYEKNLEVTFGYKGVLENVPESLIASGSVHPDDAEIVRKMYHDLENGAKTTDSVARYKMTNGEWAWLKTNYTVVCDKSGKPMSAIGSAVDVTEQKEAQQRYQDELDYRKSLGENAVASHRVNLTKGIVEESFSSINKYIVEAESVMNNKAFARICELSLVNREEREQYFKKFNPEQLVKDYNKGITNIEQEYHALYPDGSLRWTNMRVKLIKKPETGELIAFFNSWDIHEKKIVQAMIDAIVKMDYDYLALLDLKKKDYTIFSKTDSGSPLPPFYSSDYETEVTAYAREHLVDEDVEKNIYEMSYANLREKLAKSDIYTIYCGVKEKDGKVSHKKLQFSYLDRTEEKIMLTRADVTDIFESEKIKNEALGAALTAAEQANAAKSDFLSRMSHEIRTPMNAIIGMTAIGAQSIGDDDQVADCLSKIGISSRFLLSLINDILDMSRIESGKVLLKKDKIPFEEFISGINTICYTQAQSKDIDYECIVDKNAEDYYIGDAMKLQQIIINILSNAVKFTPTSGKVSLHVSQIKRMKDNAILRFVINDTGCGISEEFMPRLFEPFAQEHSGTTSMYSGTGLGLSICKNLVELMDGKISVRSIVGIGSEFTIDLKLGVTEESKQHREEKPLIDFAKLNALVVDDDVTVCEHTHIVLSDIGVKSEWVDSGKKAIEKVLEKWETKSYYDLILIDWKMPDMDGIETARRIRQIVGPDVTIIIMTAYDWVSIENEAKIAGVNLLMNKPLFKSSLISAFKTALGEKTEEKPMPLTMQFDFTGKRLLLAEDHPLNVEVAKRLLERKGFKVDIAENGVRAVEMFTIAPEKYYDAILMDIRMPVMDGLQATTNIRHLSKADATSIPIIAMTANAFDDDMEKSKLVGMNAHLAKPIEPNQLYQTLYNFIGVNTSKI